MSNGLKTQGSELFFVDDSTTDGMELVKMVCPSGIQGIGAGSRDQVEDTCLDNTDQKTYQAGLGNPAPMSVDFVFSPQAVSHQVLLDLKARGDVIKWLVSLSESTQQPTLDTDGGFIKPTTRSHFEFSGYVSEVAINIQANDVVRGSMTIQVSGSTVFTPAAA